VDSSLDSSPDSSLDSSLDEGSNASFALEVSAASSTKSSGPGVYVKVTDQRVSALLLSRKPGGGKPTCFRFLIFLALLNTNYTVESTSSADSFTGTLELVSS
jgi:hypothetical protein